MCVRPVTDNEYVQTRNPDAHTQRRKCAHNKPALTHSHAHREVHTQTLACSEYAHMHMHMHTHTHTHTHWKQMHTCVMTYAHILRRQHPSSFAPPHSPIV
jgi:hypothetical protein